MAYLLLCANVQIGLHPLLHRPTRWALGQILAVFAGKNPEYLPDFFDLMFVLEVILVYLNTNFKSKIKFQAKSDPYLVYNAGRYLG